MAIVQSSELEAKEGLLSRVDAELESLLDAVRLVAQTNRPVILVSLWRHIPYLALLPFHLHLRWADKVEGVPLTGRLGYIPFFDIDFSIINEPLYRMGEARQVRQSARTVRAYQNQRFQDDLKNTDWESAGKRNKEIESMIFPGSAFIKVDRLTSSGKLLEGHRPHLGRSARRDAPRPSLLVMKWANVNGIEEALAQLDILVVNIQGLRGRRITESVQRAIDARRSDTRLVVVASSPSDLIATDMVNLLPTALLLIKGNEPQLKEVLVLCN